MAAGFNLVFEALSHPVRRQILELLNAGPRSAGALAAEFDLSKPTLSAHFAKLREAELVVVERQGTSLVYHLNTSILQDALKGLLSLKGTRQ